MALNLGLGVPFLNMSDWKGIREEAGELILHDK
jgi:hypothetical protein